MEYKIKEVSEITNIPQSKIRFYEKQGLLPEFKRDKNNIRIFSEKDIELLNLIRCLRNIGMSVKEIRTNLDILADSSNNQLAINILIDHRNKLEEQRKILKNHIEKINLNLESRQSN
ncbi:MerR family transcriptional regulator [Romboutsia ilealis]|uniref:MerR family transcriptional regulator n=1 Tax=Romboutsia faecis TaxID=2764597 RepID=A0ABR7JTX6_9FIRM|nr:MerR family transcriptional regulator [Romboutsia faecis]MBC5998213.1 MerR family transcriptional regulator [Romboutsia faecis]MRN25833.1 MerR family transcriptional regulator [Romboutsia ilealis]